MTVRSGSLNGHLRTNLFETATPIRRTSGRSPRGGDHHGTNHTSSRARCVELSELTFSILIWVMGRAAAITPSLFPSGKLSEIHFCTCCKRLAAWQYHWSPTDDMYRNGYAHASRIRPKPSRRLPPSLHPCLAPYLPPSVLGPAFTLCGVRRVGFQHPNPGDGSTSGNGLREGSGNTLR